LKKNISNQIKFEIQQYSTDIQRLISAL